MFDLNCILNLCKSATGVSDVNNLRNINISNINWVQVGTQLVNAAKPYVVQYLGEVQRPQKVDVNDAFTAAQDVNSDDVFKPYEVPKTDAGITGTAGTGESNDYTAKTQDDADVRALLIGINYYGTSAELSGCVNDVRQEMASFQRTGFPVEEMAILVDEKNFPNCSGLPTRANIVKFMAWLVKDAKAGDILFMHYSGHGTQTKAANDSYEQYDQVICPCDYDTAGCILDDDIFDLMCKNLPKGVRLTVLFDCCHSGSMLDLPYMFQGTGAVTASNDNYHMNQVRQDNFCAADVLMISGCADTQTSADVGNTATIGNGTSGAGGAGTQCLTYTLLNTQSLTYKNMVVKTREMLLSKGFDQIPQLSASKPLNLNDRFSLSKLFTVDSTMSRSLPVQFL